MNARLLYTHNTPADRDIAELQRRLQKRGVELELIDADSREGSALSELYDLVGRPSVFVTTAEGQLIGKWQIDLPSPDDVVAVYMVG
jgi:hypothetical protein